ncbi:hypothetical protein VTK56DRAFT_1551 [Thermocarpiscus australiensis]
MASPIGYLINPPDPPAPPPPQKPAFTCSSGNVIPLNITPPAHPAATPGAPLIAAPSVPSNGPTPALPSPFAQQLPASHSTTQGLYQCAHCLRRYSRPEHLQRHIATHTLGKRFTCDICPKAFARADLLKRHRANHDDTNGTKRRRITSSAGASRVAHACLACAKARVKCEELKPCTRCRNRGLACEVAPSEGAAMLLHLSGQRVGLQQETTNYSFPSDVRQTGDEPTQDLSSSTLSQAVSPGINGNVTAGCKSAFRDECQFPTPATSLDQSNPDTLRSYPDNDVEHVVQDNTRAPFPDFLRDVLYDQSLGNAARLAEAQGPPVLDFYDDANLDFKEFDFGLLDHWNFDAARTMADPAAGSEDPVGMTAMRSALVKMWTESPWRWTPQKTDSGYREHSNLPLPPKDARGAGNRGSGTAAYRVCKDTLHSSCRDKILAIVLSTCRDNSMANRVASSFPSADAMDSWIHIFLAAHLCQVSSWIHYGSLSLNNQLPEWLAIAVAAGAILTPVPTVRGFGFALQEAVRIAIPGRFEENNKAIAEIGAVQALMLVQDVGLWSGNRRKMEIAECHLSIPIAMMRYRGKFGRAWYPDISICPSDEGKALEEKWKKWYQFESWKRLVFHAYLRDAQVSMTQFNNPSMSYAELTLPLPCSKELWFARSAEEFKIRYLEQAGTGDDRRQPSLGDLFRDINSLSSNHQYLDVQLSISIYLHSFWSLIWEYRQLNSVHRPVTQSPAYASSTTLLLDSRHQELCKQLETFRLVTRGWHELSAQENVVLHLLLLNLHVPLSDLQLFTGKEGEDQARRVYPALQRWSGSPEARQALWHAGQILRQGRMFPPGHLKDFYAIAVHHAALCLWTYGVVARASNLRGGGGGCRDGGGEMYVQRQMRLPSQVQHGYHHGPIVLLDGEETPVVHRWLSFGQGRPAIQRRIHGSGEGGGEAGNDRGATSGIPPQATECLVEDPRACMEVAQETLRANFVGVWESLPPLSENIIHVLKQLEKAARAVGMG